MMNMKTIGIGIALLACTVPAQAAEPRAVLSRAVKAMGGELDPAKRPATLLKITFKGEDTLAGSGEFRYQPTKTRRCNLVARDGEREHTLKLMIDGTSGWVTEDDRQPGMGGEEILMLRGLEIMLNPSLALPLVLDDKDVALKLLDDTTIDGKTVQVLALGIGDKQLVTLFLDEATGLPVKASGKILFGSDLSVVFSDWRELGPEGDVRVLNEAGLNVDAAGLLAYLRKQVPAPEKVAAAAGLVKQLGDDTFEVREKASADLLLLGSVAVPALQWGLVNEDVEIVRRARECLDLIAKRDDDAVRAAAIRQVVTLKVEGGEEVLLALLPGGNEATAREVKAALVAIVERDGKPTPALVQALDDSEPIVRTAAAAVLGKDGCAYRQQPDRRLHVRGPKVPMKLTILESDRQVAEVDVIDVQLFNQFDAKLFAKP